MPTLPAIGTAWPIVEKDSESNRWTNREPERLKNKYPDGSKKVHYSFVRFKGHMHKHEQFNFRYIRPIKDFISDIDVVRDGKVVASKEIEVNKPLHYGGYHFYQSSYDAENEQYTVLSVVSDTGLYLVYAGYILLLAGVFWHFWLRHGYNTLCRRTKNGN